MASENGATAEAIDAPQGEDFVTVARSSVNRIQAITALTLCLGLGAGLAAPSTAEATIQTFSDNTAFVTATGAVATAPLPALGPSTAQGTTTVGDLTFSSPNNLFFDNFSTRIAGNEIIISGNSNLDVTLAAPVFALGFDFVEPHFDPNLGVPVADFVASTFEVTLLNGATPVGTFPFNRPEDTLSFVGVWSDTAFDGIQIRETVGGPENEIFGQFYAGTAPADFTPPHVILAAPPAFALFAFGLAGLSLMAAPARRQG